MTQDNVTLALEKFKKQIPKEKLDSFRKYLEEATDESINELMEIKIKSKTKTFLLAFFIGGLALDRFYIGDKDLGISKLILRIIAVIAQNTIFGIILSIASTIWCIADIFITYKKAKQINYDNLTSFLSRHKDNTIK